MSAVIVFFLLLAGAVTAAVLTRYRPRLIPAAAVLLSGLSLLLWLIVRTQLPIPSPLAPSSLTYVWRIDEPAWLITAWLLLLLFALALGHLQRAESGPPLMMFAFLLLAFTLPALWADSVYSLIWGLVLLVIPWLAAVWHNVIPDVRRYLAYITMLITVVLLLFYTAVSVPASGGWEMAGWPAASVTAVLLAAVILIGIWPFFNWRLRLAQVPLPLNIILFLMPAAVGGLLLSRIAASAQLNLTWQLLLTAMALLGYLRGVRLTWARLHLPGSAITAILFAQAQLIILAGLWAGPTAVLALTQALILTAGILTLAAGQPINRRRWWRAVAPALALAALAGLPLTASFVGLSALYDTWLANDRFLLLLVTGLLIAPLVTAVTLFFHPETAPQADETVGHTAVRDAAAILLGITLIAVRGVTWGGIHPLTWIMILLPPVIGLLLTRRLPQVRESQALIRQAFTFGPALNRTRDRVKDVLHTSGTAVSDAVAILETDGGLVWVFILALLLYLVIGNR
ncbi:MAG: hypothetical protein HF973_08095 [Chloroflexi bacterium]|nr:hypothetical protein [Chloroflexota bacterium]